MGNDDYWQQHFTEAHASESPALDAASDAVWTQLVSTVLALSGPFVGRTVLEAGCGAGAFLRCVRALGAVRADGFDSELALNGKQARDARAKLPDDHECAVWSADLNDPVGWHPVLGTYDVVAAIEVLFFADDIGATVAALWDRVGPAGKLVFTVGNHRSPLVRHVEARHGDRYQLSDAVAVNAVARSLPGVDMLSVVGLRFLADQRLIPFEMTGPSPSGIEPYRLIVVASKAAGHA